MKALHEWSHGQLPQLRVVLTDIDDTLTTNGQLCAASLDALDRAKRAGLLRIAVTGRPTYWTLPLLRLCNFDAVIAENGASAFWLDGKGVQHALFYADAQTRKQHKQRLERFAVQLEQRFPGVKIALDAQQRIGDLAFDIGEKIPALPVESVKEIVTFIREHGLYSTTSNIHAHASVMPFSKQTMTQRLLAEIFGIDDDAARDCCVFIGDSPNDASMFAHYPWSVGVANVKKYLDRFDTHPRFVTQHECGAGFVELINFLLDKQND
ncbi:HAD family hydrolase [Undibacterium sp. RuRC25W]|uniref:HAD family hydrolase n=1 Tax=Undibacterium sp. RuRC25W TaxID=3413047 RepID=UPI003BF3DE92